MGAPNLYQNLVNQNLFFARTLLEQEVKQGVNVSPSYAEEQLMRALREGAIVLLHRAYQLYLRELAEHYRCQASSARDIKTLMSALGEAGKTSGEVQELENLERDPVSWLSELELAFIVDKMEQAGGSLSREQGFLDGIALKEGSPAPLAAERVLCWHSAFKDMLVRQREQMVEW